MEVVGNLPVIRNEIGTTRGRNKRRNVCQWKLRSASTVEAGDRLPSLDAVASWTNWLMIEENRDCSSGCKETRAAMSESEAVWGPGEDMVGRARAAGTDVLGGTDDCVGNGCVGDVVVAEEGWVETIGDVSSMLCIVR